ncbi:hypothetical protein PMAYCL1PPCAC_17016, partial [Pristionchus mayeri]
QERVIRAFLSIVTMSTVIHSINDDFILPENVTSTDSQRTLDKPLKADSNATLQEDLKRLEDKRHALLEHSQTITEEFQQKYPDLEAAELVERE